MEKFGIFNILSALGNLAEEKGETAKKEEESAPAPPAPAPAERAGIFTGEERMNKMLRQPQAAEIKNTDCANNRYSDTAI